jgi:hypothetical protein
MSLIDFHAMVRHGIYNFRDNCGSEKRKVAQLNAMAFLITPCDYGKLAILEHVLPGCFNAKNSFNLHRVIAGARYSYHA